MHTGVIKALTIGDTTGLTDATKELFLRDGNNPYPVNIGITPRSCHCFCILYRHISLAHQSKIAPKRSGPAICRPYHDPFCHSVHVYKRLEPSRHTGDHYGRCVHARDHLRSQPAHRKWPFPQRSCNSDDLSFFSFSPSFQLTFISVLFIILANKAYGHKLVQMPRLPDGCYPWSSYQ